MPFSDSFDDVYEVAIQPACEAAGAYAERVDKQIFAGSIFDRVYNQIAKADVIVADMSERDPNVFYEVGYAHALGKTTILLTRDEADIPFDLRQYPHVVYRASLAKLKAELERRVRWHLENPTKIETAPQKVEVRVNGNMIVDRPAVAVRARGEPAALTLSVGLQNRAQKTVRTLHFVFGCLHRRLSVAHLTKPALNTRRCRLTTDVSSCPRIRRCFCRNSGMSLTLYFTKGMTASRPARRLIALYVCTSTRGVRTIHSL